MASKKGGSKKKKRLGAFFAFDEALESLVSIPSTHTLMSPESQDITARTPESDLGKKTASIFQKTNHGDESMADMINMSPITKCAIFWNPLESCLHDKYKISNLSLIQKCKLM